MSLANDVSVTSLSLEAAEQALQSFEHDAFHLPAYSQAIAAQEGGAPIWLLADCPAGAVFVSLFLRPCPALPGAYDAANGYGYPGLLCRPNPGFNAAAALEGCLPAIEVRLRELGAISLFLRAHPYLGPAADAFPSGYEMITHGDVVAMSPQLGPDGMWSAIRRDHRKTIEKLNREDFRCEIDTDWTALDAFEQIYADTMRRRGATGYYFFNHAYFSGLRDALGDSIQLFVVRQADQVAAAGLYFFHRQFAHAHLTATATAFLSRAPSKLLYWTAAQEAAKRGIECFNLGGGVGGQADGLFEFKSGFSPRRASFYTARRVLEPVAMAGMLAHWRIEHPNCRPQPGMFPPHRATPMPLEQELLAG